METPKCCIESCLAAWNKVIFHLWLGIIPPLPASNALKPPPKKSNCQVDDFGGTPATCWAYSILNRTHAMWCPPIYQLHSNHIEV